MKNNEAREFIRHPTQIPIQVACDSAVDQMNLHLNNVSVGGLCFEAPLAFEPNSIVTIRIPFLKPIFKVQALVQWCKKVKDHFDMGVRFLDYEDAFRVRMVEQVCHIEQYRKELMKKEGKRITRNRASYEWIARHGSDFPST